MNVLPAETIDVGDPGTLAGFRPEHIRLGANGTASAMFDAVVEVVEYLGDEQLAHLRLGERGLVAKLPVEPRLQIGTRIAFAVPLDRIALFDEQTQTATHWSAAAWPDSGGDCYATTPAPRRSVDANRRDVERHRRRRRRGRWRKPIPVGRRMPSR